MKKDDDEEKDEQEELSLEGLSKIGLVLFGAPDPDKVAKRRKEMQILESLEYLGGERTH